MSLPRLPVLRRIQAPLPAGTAPASALPGTLARGSALRALRSEAFRVYFTGSILSNLGTWLQNTAQVLLAYKLTHSVFAVGLVTCVQFSSSLVMGPLAAVVAGRIGGRRMLIGTQVFSAGVAGCMAGMQILGILAEGALLAGALLLGLAFTFALPVQAALLPRLVDDADTDAAVALNSISYNVGRAAAPVFCVLLVTSRAGFAAAFALNAASFLFYAFLLGQIRLRDKPASATKARLWTGARMAAQRPRIWLMLAIVAAVTFADDPILVQRRSSLGIWHGSSLVSV
jgi:hypothetical protein